MAELLFRTNPNPNTTVSSLLRNCNLCITQRFFFPSLRPSPIFSLFYFVHWALRVSTLDCLTTRTGFQCWYFMSVRKFETGQIERRRTDDVIFSLISHGLHGVAFTRWLLEHNTIIQSFSWYSKTAIFSNEFPDKKKKYGTLFFHLVIISRNAFRITYDNQMVGLPLYWLCVIEAISNSKTIFFSGHVPVAESKKRREPIRMR